MIASRICVDRVTSRNAASELDASTPTTCCMKTTKNHHTWLQVRTKNNNTLCTQSYYVYMPCIHRVICTDYICEARPTRADEYTAPDTSDPHAVYDVHFCGADDENLVFCHNGGTCRSSRVAGVRVYSCNCAEGWYGPTCEIGKPASSSSVFIF